MNPFRIVCITPDSTSTSFYGIALGDNRMHLVQSSVDLSDLSAFSWSIRASTEYSSNDLIDTGRTTCVINDKGVFTIIFNYIKTDSGIRYDPVGGYIKTDSGIRYDPVGGWSNITIDPGHGPKESHTNNLLFYLNSSSNSTASSTAPILVHAYTGDKATISFGIVDENTKTLSAVGSWFDESFKHLDTTKNFTSIEPDIYIYPATTYLGPTEFFVPIDNGGRPFAILWGGPKSSYALELGGPNAGLAVQIKSIPDSKSPTGLIAGVVAGVVVISIAVLYIIRRRKRQAKTTESNDSHLKEEVKSNQADTDRNNQEVKNSQLQAAPDLYSNAGAHPSSAYNQPYTTQPMNLSIHPRPIFVTTIGHDSNSAVTQQQHQQQQYLEGRTGIETLLAAPFDPSWRPHPFVPSAVDQPARTVGSSPQLVADEQSISYGVVSASSGEPQLPPRPTVPTYTMPYLPPLVGSPHEPLGENNPQSM
ncbi:hypothetical protein BGX27_000849 [Mortierella sp. AM989]|nr:hypothetical protein BGX27_000849 [Mortierella sp. AM989]